MASGYPGRDLCGSFGFGLGSAVQVRSDGSTLIKRSLSELERQQQQMLFTRTVKSKTFCGSNPYPITAPTAETEWEKKSTAISNQLQELERQLLLDDEDDDNSDVVSVTGSTVTMMQQLISPFPSPSPTPSSPPIAAIKNIQNALSPSPTTSSSSHSSTSYSASCSPPNSSAQPRQLLIDTATAIADGNLGTAEANIAVLKRAANPCGDPEQRLTAMMVSALSTRTNSSFSSTAVGSPITHHPSASLCSSDHQMATQMLYDMSPFFKLGLLAANLAILDATKDDPQIHVVDFDIGEGGQYAALIHALAERSRQSPSFPPTLKITAVADPTFPFNSTATINSLRLTGEKIAKLSDRLGLKLVFRIVNKKTSELDRATLGCEQGEALAVNFAFVLSRIADESVSPANPRDQLLRMVKSLEPKIVTMAEQDINFNTAPFLTRFIDGCAYYGSLLDSLDAMVGRDSPDRARVEACIGRKAANSVAQEGPDRLERPEVFGKWRARMGMAGLKPVPFGPGVTDPVRSRFGSLRSNPGFTFTEVAGGLGFGWMGRVLTVASAWR